MFKKILLGLVLLFVVGGVGLYFWARAVLTGERVRTAVSAQISKAIGQPVSIGGLGATIFPRVTMTLDDVGIGQPVRMLVKRLYVGTDLRALLSKRIEHAVVRLAGARIELPLPAFTLGAAAPPATPAAESAGSPVEIASVDEISLSDVEIVSGGRTVRGDVALVPQGRGVTIKDVTLKTGATTVNLTGQIADLTGPSGELVLKARGLDLVELLAFVDDFSKGAGIKAPAGAGPPRSRDTPMSMDIKVAIDADRATLGTLVLDGLNGRARITTTAVALDEVRFRVFGGRYEGSLALGLGETQEFRLSGALTDVDVASAMIFAGSPNTITGKLSGKIDLAGRGMTADGVLKTARGIARVDIKDGSVKGLGLVRGVVLATSVRKDSLGQAANTSALEPFSRLGLTATIGNGAATTDDLRFESKDVLLSARGVVRLDGSAVELSGPVQLSNELSQQAGRDLVRYTQKDGRVTVPALVSGSIDHLQVRVDVGDMAKRAITNKAAEEAKKALRKIIKR